MNLGGFNSLNSFTIGKDPVADSNYLDNGSVS